MPCRSPRLSESPPNKLVSATCALAAPEAWRLRSVGVTEVSVRQPVADRLHDAPHDDANLRNLGATNFNVFYIMQRVKAPRLSTNSPSALRQCNWGLLASLPLSGAAQRAVAIAQLLEDSDGNCV
jgi:hypothetical protein